jgi:hypothetical protein
MGVRSKPQDSYEIDLPPFSSVDELRRRESRQLSAVRSLISMSELDSKIQAAIAECGNVKHFLVVVWRDEPDATDCNWNARIERIQGNTRDCDWCDVIPQMRERYNLID